MHSLCQDYDKEGNLEIIVDFYRKKIGKKKIKELPKEYKSVPIKYRRDMLYTRFL